MPNIGEQLKVRELVPTIATIARAAGWEVVFLHANKANPAGTSLPDLMITLEGNQPIMVKALTSKMNLSHPQQKWFNHYLSCGFRCMAFHPEDIPAVLEVFNSATVAE